MPTSVNVIQPSFDVLKPVHTIKDNSVKEAVKIALLQRICRIMLEIKCCSATNRRAVASIHAKPAQVPHRGALPESLSDVSNPSIAKCGCEDSTVAMFAAILQLSTRRRGSQRDLPVSYALRVLGTSTQWLSFPPCSCLAL